MTEEKKIAVFGGTGKLGRLFTQLALDGGYSLRLLVRDPAKCAQADEKGMELIVGDATNYDDVKRTIDGCDMVVSCLGRTKKGLHIMHTSYDHIMTAAAAQKDPPRCLMISSIGLGGTSWLIKLMLSLIAGKSDIDDFERADARVREDSSVPFALIRPYALTDKDGQGRYKLLPGKTATFAKAIARADVARFMFDCLENQQWDGRQGVMLGGV